MFKRDVKGIGELLLRNLRVQGLETPLMQRRLISSWPDVAGTMVAGYTTQLYIHNQTLFVHLSNPALRADLSMRRRELTNKLNAHVGTMVIADIRFL